MRWFLRRKSAQGYLFCYTCMLGAILIHCCTADAVKEEGARIVLEGNGDEKDQPKAVYLLDPLSPNEDFRCIFPFSEFVWSDVVGIQQGLIYGILQRPKIDISQANTPWTYGPDPRPYTPSTLQCVNLVSGERTIFSGDIHSHVTGGNRIGMIIGSPWMLRVFDMKTEACREISLPDNLSLRFGTFSPDTQKIVLFNIVWTTHCWSAPSADEEEKSAVYIVDAALGKIGGPYRLSEALMSVACDQGASMILKEDVNILAHAWLDEDTLLFALECNQCKEYDWSVDIPNNEVFIESLDTVTGVMKLIGTISTSFSASLQFFPFPAVKSVELFSVDSSYCIDKETIETRSDKEFVKESGLFRWIQPIQPWKIEDIRSIGQARVLFGAEVVFYPTVSGTCTWPRQEEEPLKVSPDGATVLWRDYGMGRHGTLMTYSAYDGEVQMLFHGDEGSFFWVDEKQLMPSPQKPEVPEQWTSVESIAQPAGRVKGFQTDVRKDRGKEMLLTVKTSKPVYQERDTIEITLSLTAAGEDGFWVSPPVIDPQLVRGTVQNSVFTLPIWKWLPIQEKPAPIFLKPGQTLESTSTIAAKTIGDYQLRISYIGGDKEQWIGACRADCLFAVQGKVLDSTALLNERLQYLLEDFLEHKPDADETEVVSSLKELGPTIVPLLVEMAESYGSEPDESENSQDVGRYTLLRTRKQRLFSIIVALDYPECFPLYEKWIKSDTADERVMAIEAIGSHIVGPRDRTENKAEGIALLLDIMRNGTEKDRRAAAAYMTHICTPEVREAFVPYMQSSDEWLRRLAAQFCINEVMASKMKYREAKEQIEWFLNDSAWHVRNEGPHFFGRYFKKAGYVYEADAEEAFQRLLSDPETIVQGSATDVLYERQDVPADQWLYATADDLITERAVEAQRIIQELETQYKQSLGPARAKDWGLIFHDAGAAERCKETIRAWAEFTKEHPKYPSRTH